MYSETSISGPRYPENFDIRTKICPGIELADLIELPFGGHLGIFCLDRKLNICPDIEFFH